MPSAKTPTQPIERKSTAWEDVCLDEESGRGAIVRFHYRSLPPSTACTLAWRYGYHTWMELLDKKGDELSGDRRLVWGVYEGRDDKDQHNVVSEVRSMEWEYEIDGGLERWGNVNGRKHGYMDITLPLFDESDFKEVLSFVYDDFRIDLGPYGYLLPWAGPLLGVWNCQRYVRVYCRKRGGPWSIFHELGRRFWRGQSD